MPGGGPRKVLALLSGDLIAGIEPTHAASTRSPRMSVPRRPSGSRFIIRCRLDQARRDDPALAGRMGAKKVIACLETCDCPVRGACDCPVRGACADPVRGACAGPIRGACAGQAAA